MKTKNLVLGIVGLLVVLMLILGYWASGPASTPYFDDKSPVMYFYRDNCEFCLAEKPILTQLAGEGFRVKKMDVNANPNYWQDYGIDGTPTFISKSGDKLTGLTQIDPLREYLAKNGAKIA